MTVALAPGEETGFRMASWRRVLLVKASPAMGGALQLDFTSPLQSSVRKLKRRLRLGETAVLTPGKDIDRETVGDTRDAIRCTWAE